MERPRTSTVVLIGLFVSLVLHVTVILPTMVAVMKFGPEPRAIIKARFEPDAFRDHEKLPDNLVPLGLDKSEASTMTWIGYEEYEKHMAALSEVEQAAFQTEPTGADAMQATAGQSPSPTDKSEPPTAVDPFDELETWLKGMEGPGPPVGEPAQPDARFQTFQDMLDQLEEMMEQQTLEQKQQQENPAQADQESDATSTLEVSMKQLTLGKPLAAKGLRIKPRKPVFTALTLLTAVPADPKAELRFRRDGKPVTVRLLESSGDPRIDEAVVNSLYRWRATGKPLRELKRGQTIPVRIRILLNER